MSTLDKNLLLEMFRKMEEIRRMDLKIAQLVKKGKVPGMTHFSVGEEAANVGAMLALNPDDLIKGKVDLCISLTLMLGTLVPMVL